MSAKARAAEIENAQDSKSQEDTENMEEADQDAYLDHDRFHTDKQELACHKERADVHFGVTTSRNVATEDVMGHETGPLAR